MAHLKDNFNNQLRISVNVSSAQILHQNLPQLIQKNLDKYGLHSSCLELEVTENMLVGQSRKSQQVLNELEGMGIKLSIDAFGT